MEDSGSYAIITAFTPNFYEDFYLFYRSLRRHSRVPLMVFPVDYDEPPDLPDDVYSINLTEAELKPFRNIGERWVQWFKPSLIRLAMKRHKLDTVLWLDSDIVVLDDIRPMFEKALKTFFVMADNFAPQDCLNDDRLYEESANILNPTKMTEQEAKIALNSGVIGIRMPRDQKIMKEWEERTKIVARHPNLMKYVSLYDQGTLLWAMRDLKLLNKVIEKPKWNNNTKRNAYEGTPAQKWPVPDVPRMGGDLFEEVKFDNPNTVIAHYAGLPKLTHLLQRDAKETQQFRRNKYRNVQPVRIFGVGLERAGTHSLSEILRRCCRVECWVRHEHTPTLSEQARDKWLGKEFDLGERLDIFKRRDVQFVSEVNHRLGFFIPEIKEAIPESKFVLLLRNPLDLIRSRLINFSGWSSELYKFPGHYQFDIYGIHKSFGAGSSDQNKHRLRPRNTSELSPIQLHVWEVVETLKFLLKDLRKLPEDDYQIIWIEQLRESIGDLSKLIPPHYMYWGEAMRWSGIKFGASVRHSDESMQWIDDQIIQNADFILSSIMGVLNEHGIQIFERCNCV